MRTILLWTLLAVCGTLGAQSVDRIWQPYPFTVLAGAIPVEDGALLALEAGPPHDMSYPGLRLIRINAAMEELWNSPLSNFSAGSRFRRLQHLPDGRIFVAVFNLLPCQDTYPMEAYLVWYFLNGNTGEQLDAGFLHIYSWGYFREEAPLIVWDEAEELLLLRQLQFGFASYSPGSMTWDTLPITHSKQEYLASHTLPDGRLLAQTNDTLWRFSSSWEVKDSLSRFWTGTDTLIAVHGLPDDRLLGVFKRHLAVLNASFELETLRAFQGETIATAVPDGDQILMAGEGPAGPFIRRLNAELTTLETGPVMSNDTRIQAIFPGDGSYLFAGGETTNVFAVAQLDPLDPAPISYDLAIDSVIFDVTQFNVYDWSYLITVSNLRIRIRNQGQMAVDSIFVTLKYPLNFFSPCLDPGWHSLVKEMAIEPGNEGDFLLLNSFQLYGVRTFLDDMDHLPLCVIISGPDGRLDADHDNDTFCSIIALTPSGLEGSAAEPMVRVWPNPVHTTLHLDWAGEGQVLVQVVNFLGQPVEERRLMSGVRELDVSSWPSGWYHLVLRDTDGLWLGRSSFVKM